MSPTIVVKDPRKTGSSLLAGKLFDTAGEPLISVHTTKPGSDSNQIRPRYRYYVSKAAHHGTGGNAPRLRIPARDIERLVAGEVAALFRDPLELAARCELSLPPPRMVAISQLFETLAGKFANDNANLREIIETVRLDDRGIAITVSIAAIAGLLDIGQLQGGNATLELACSAKLTRTGRALRLVQPGGALAVQDDPDRTVVRLIARGQRWWAVLATGEIDPLTLARNENLSQSYITRVVRLAFLAPEVDEAALRGGLRGSIDGAALLAPGAVTGSWDEQVRRFLPEKSHC